jgi:hypothetical protein
VLHVCLLLLLFAVGDLLVMALNDILQPLWDNFLNEKEAAALLKRVNSGQVAQRRHACRALTWVGLEGLASCASMLRFAVCVVVLGPVEKRMEAVDVIMRCGCFCRWWRWP